MFYHNTNQVPVVWLRQKILKEKNKSRQFLCELIPDCSPTEVFDILMFTAYTEL